MKDASAIPADGYIRRLASDYASAWALLLPPGSAWPRDPQSVLQKTILGMSGIWARPASGDLPTSTLPAINVDGRAADLLETESDPRSTVEMLDSWEACFGLPDLCLAEPLTIGDRQKALTARVTMLGGQSIAWFVAYAKSIGYTIEVIEHAPYMCGVSQCGNTLNWNNEANPWYRWELGAPEMRFYWTVEPQDMRLTWFRTGGGGGQCGVDPMLRIAIATDLECAFRRYHPAHTDVVFSYTGLIPYNSMSGTP